MDPLTIPAAANVVVAHAAAHSMLMALASVVVTHAGHGMPGNIAAMRCACGHALAMHIAGEHACTQCRCPKYREG